VCAGMCVDIFMHCTNQGAGQVPRAACVIHHLEPNQCKEGRPQKPRPELPHAGTIALQSVAPRAALFPQPLARVGRGYADKRARKRDKCARKEPCKRAARCPAPMPLAGVRRGCADKRALQKSHKQSPTKEPGKAPNSMRVLHCFFLGATAAKNVGCRTQGRCRFSTSTSTARWIGTGSVLFIRVHALCLSRCGVAGRWVWLIPINDIYVGFG